MLHSSSVILLTAHILLSIEKIVQKCQETEAFFALVPWLWDFFAQVCSKVHFPTKLVLAAAAEISPMEAHVLAKDAGMLCERWVCAAGAVGGHRDLWA